MKQLIIIGNLGFEAVVKEHNGSKFIEFSVAVNERYKKADGTQVETTDWINCTYRNIALAQYLKKGDRIMVQGNMKVNVFQGTKDKQWRAGINLNAFNVQLLSSKKDDATEPQTPNTQPQTEAVADDLPF